MRACQAGELRAFEELVDRHHKAVHRIVDSYVRDPDEAQDVAQEVFVKAYGALHRLVDPDRFGAWLSRAAQRGALNALRARRRAQTLRATIAQERVGWPPEPAHTDGGIVPAALARLPADQARLFSMHYLDEVPLTVVAQRLGCSPQGAKQRLYRIRQQLRRELVTMLKDDGLQDAMPSAFAGLVVARLLETGRGDRLYMRYDSARARFQEALDAAPAHASALLELGRTYDPLLGASSEDVAVLERAASAAPESPAVLGELAAAYLQHGQTELHAAVRRKCLELCDRRLADSPSEPQALKAKAQVLAGDEDWAGAERLLAVAVDGNPDDQEARFLLARAIDRQGRQTEVMPLYQQVLASDARTVWAYFARRQMATHLAFRSRDGRRAVALMEEVWQLTRRPNEAGNLVYFYSATEQWQQAIAVYRQVEQCAHHPRVYVTVGVAHMKDGHAEAADGVLRAALAGATDPGIQAEANLYLASALLAQGRELEAREALVKGLSLELHARQPLACEQTSAFWRPWTEVLAQALESLAPLDPRAEGLYRQVREQLRLDAGARHS